MANFLWNDQEGNHKYHLANFQSLAQRKDFGGWGIPDHSCLNMCLLSSWINRYHRSGNVIWKQSLIINITPQILMFSAALKWVSLLFGKASSGPARLPN
jgi:hypothetical protein